MYIMTSLRHIPYLKIHSKLCQIAKLLIQSH